MLALADGAPYAMTTVWLLVALAGAAGSTLGPAFGCEADGCGMEAGLETVGLSSTAAAPFPIGSSHTREIEPAAPADGAWNEVRSAAAGIEGRILNRELTPVPQVQTWQASRSASDDRVLDGVAAFARSGFSMSEAAGLQIDLEANGRRFFSDVPTKNGDIWDERMQLSGQFRLGSVPAASVDVGMVNLRGPTADAELQFLLEDTTSWQENRVADAMFVLRVLNDRVRLTSRLARSRYRLFGNYRDTPSTEDAQRDAAPSRRRFLGRGLVEGSAWLERIDADVWRSPDFTLSLFGAQSRVDDDFYSVEVGGDDPFRKPGRSVRGWGAKFEAGGLDVILERQQVRRRTRLEDQVSATAHLELAAFGTEPGGGSAFLPESAYLRLARGTVAGEGLPPGRDDQVFDGSAGLGWRWEGGGYASVDLWQSWYDSRQPGDAGADWEGHGGYVRAGLTRERWGVDAGIGFYRSDDKGVPSHSVDSGYDANLALAYRPDGFPEIDANLFFGTYATDLRTERVRGRTDMWSVAVTLDLTKQLLGRSSSEGEGLKLMMRLEDRTDSGSYGNRREEDGVIALLFHRKF